jgi:hypothetical protein
MWGKPTTEEFMARLVEQLTEAKIRNLVKAGLHPDGRGLYLQIRPGGARSWIYRFTLNQRTRDMGLGALADVSLVKARVKATAARALVADGIDPIERAKTQAAIPVTMQRSRSPTFEEAAEAYMADRLKRLRSETHRHQWRQTLQDYAYPIIGSIPVADVETNDVSGRFGKPSARQLHGCAAASNEFSRVRPSGGGTAAAPTQQTGAAICRKRCPRGRK